MRWRRPATTRGGRTTGIALLILGLVHTPLPQADFHNIRHHDAPGEVCEYHDHLLRWHPGAGVARDVAVLHWHWFFPSTPGTDVSPQGPAGLAVHAHAPAWMASTWDDGPRLAAGSAPRPLERPAACPLDFGVIDPPAAAFGFGPDVGGRAPLAFGATFAPGVSLTSLLHRWVC